MKRITKLLLLMIVVLLLSLVSCKKNSNKTPKLEEVNFTNMITSINKGDIFVVEYSKQENVTVTFTSSNTSVATVANNTITAVNVGNFTLTAKFTLGEEFKIYEFTIEVKAILSSITYELDGGVNPASAPSTYEEGKGVVLPIPTRDGYEFLGWTLSNDSTDYIIEISATQVGSVTLYAKWNKLPVYSNITYELDGGVNPETAPSTYEEGKVLDLPIPTREGYEFLGWTLSKDSTDYITEISAAQVGSVTLYAKWNKIPVYSNITYELDGGVNPETAPSTYEEGKVLDLPIPTREGYEFLGWTLSKDSTDYITEISAAQVGSVTLYAKWNKLPVYSNITYELDGGVNPETAPSTYEEGKVLDLPIPTREGYEFLGWTLSNTSTKYITKISAAQVGNITLYAKWNKIPVYSNITYELDGGANPESAPTKYEEGKVLGLPTPNREGYEFLGWTLSKDSIDYITKISATQVGSVTVYAKWNKLPVYSNITYELDGGANPASAPIKYEEGKGVMLPIPTREGYVFLGWSLEATSTTYITEILSNQTGDVTVYANWEEYIEPNVGEPFTITYELNGGSWEWSVSTVSAPASGIDAISNLPEIFMADFYTYLLENNLLNSSKVASKLHVSNWAGFSAKYGDPVAWYNATSTGGYGAADGYSELFFDSVNGYEAIGGFLGTSPYKEKYANLTKHAIQLTLARYTMATTSTSFKGALGFVLDGYFYGTQGLLAADKSNAETFNALRSTIPTPTVGYEGTSSVNNQYVIINGTVGTVVKLVAPVKEGHMFLGWYTNPELTGEKVTSVIKGCTLYASWINLNAPAPVYRINYVLNGGVNPENAPEQFTFGEGVQLINPKKEGYTFVGWTTDAEGTNLITEISSFVNADVTVYANWVEGEEKIYTITYVYTDGELPTRTPSSVDEVIEYVLTSYYNWLKPSESYETFKTKVLSDWVNNKNQNTYKFYKQSGQDQTDENYFVNAPENFEEWNTWFTVFDAQVTAANGEQNAWNSYVGILRLGQWLSKTPPTTWKDAMDQALIAATNIKIPLVTEYKLGEEYDLIDLVIHDGRTFLGWYDENGNKVEKIYSNTEGDLVLTAKWSEAIPVESFEVTNEIEKLLKLSQHQLKWVFGPENATYKKVTFTSTNTDVLTVSETGLIKAVNVGVAKVLITVHGNTSLNMELEIEVYVDPYINGEFVDKSYVVVNEPLQLKATLNGYPSGDLVWTSNTPSIATVNSDGIVTGLKEGLAEIVVYYAENENVAFTFYVTVLENDPTGILKLLVDSHNTSIFTKENLLIGIKIGSEGAYYTDITGSVSKLLFEDYVVHDDYYLANPSNKSTLSGVDFITVHYAADMPYSAKYSLTGGKNLASYNQTVSGASWHYSVGNDGIWHCQSNSWGAWHAGRNTTMTWTSSGVTTSQVGTDVYSTDVTLGSDGYFYIKGVKTSVKNSTSGTKLNGMGLGVKLVGSTWYLGGHQYKSDYGYIGSTGGNGNSIGMETSVREGSDLWLTWQYTAQLCAKLLIEYELPIQRLVGHHFFSGKWCPQPMLENDLEIWYEFVELTRQEMELYQNYSNYSLSFESASEYLKDNGRVAKLPNYPECVTYTITYTDGNTTKSVTLSTMLPGILE